MEDVTASPAVICFSNLPNQASLFPLRDRPVPIAEKYHTVHRETTEPDSSPLSHQSPLHSRDFPPIHLSTENLFPYQGHIYNSGPSSASSSSSLASFTHMIETPSYEPNFFHQKESEDSPMDVFDEFGYYQPIDEPSSSWAHYRAVYPSQYDVASPSFIQLSAPSHEYASSDRIASGAPLQDSGLNYYYRDYCSQSMMPFGSQTQHPYPRSAPINCFPTQYSDRFTQEATTATASSPSIYSSPPFPELSPSSSSASPSPVNSIPIVPPPSLKLHQPRPSRSIPIISLSELASSACTEAASNSPSADQDLYSLPPAAASRPNFSSSASPSRYSSTLYSSVQSTVPRAAGPDCAAPYSPSARRTASIAQPMLPVATARSVWDGVRLPPVRGNVPQGALLCSCGCMESYSMPQR